MTALARVIAARQHLRTLRATVGAPVDAGDDVPSGATLARLLTSDIVLDHLDQTFTDHIWAETIRHEDGRDVLAVDAAALAAVFAAGKAPQLTPSQWKLLQRIAAGHVFRPTEGDLIRLPNPVTKGKPALRSGEPVNGKTFRALTELGLVELHWWWKGVEKAAATDAGVALLAERERTGRRR
ncbi:hypothetical protein ACWGJ9_11195 [Curtobacterium citreum]